MINPIQLPQDQPAAVNLLLIAYLFPPNGGISVQRALSLAKYLPPCGFNVHVLRARNAAAPSDDPGLLKYVPSSVTVHTAFAPEIPFAVRQRFWKLLSRSKKPPSRARVESPAKSGGGGFGSLTKRLARRIFCPEPEIFWVPFAMRQARRIIRRHAIDAILITAPPFSTFVIGNKLKREFPHLKFISDFRDEWLSFYVNEFDFQNSPHTKRRAAEIERDTVESSNLVVAVTESSRLEIRNRYPELPDARFVCLHNGYDPEVIARFTPRPHGLDRVVVTHLGTVYKAASPHYYLDALDKMPEAVRSRFETRFIGRIAEGEMGLLQNRKSSVKILGFMPQAEAIGRVAETDYLLLTMTNDISLPGKLFEYLAMGKPILALSRANGEVNKILQTTRTGFCVDFGDTTAIQVMLEKAAGLAEDPSWFSPDRDAIQYYERPALTRAYAGLIRSLVHPRVTAPK